jgi:hypothetical protein
MMLFGEVVMVGHAKSRDHRGGVEGGSREKLKRTSFSANETVGWLLKNLLEM